MKKFYYISTRKSTEYFNSEIYCHQFKQWSDGGLDKFKSMLRGWNRSMSGQKFLFASEECLKKILSKSDQNYLFNGYNIVMQIKWPE